MNNNSGSGGGGGNIGGGTLRYRGGRNARKYVDRLVISGHFVANKGTLSRAANNSDENDSNDAQLSHQVAIVRRQMRMTRQYVDLRTVWQLTSTSLEEPVHLQRFPGCVGTVKQISVGNSHLLVLNDRGQVFVAGDDSVSTGLPHIEHYYHDPSQSSTSPQSKPSDDHDTGRSISALAESIPTHLRLFYHSELAPYEPIRYVNASFRYSVAIGTDPNNRRRTVVLGFGSENYGNLGPSIDGQQRPRINVIQYPLRPEDNGDRDALGQFVKVASGFAHVITLTSTGRCFSHGYGYHGELATQKCEERDTPVEITHIFGGSRVKDISCGTFHSVFLTEDNQVYMCGRNVERQCSHITERIINDEILLNTWNHGGSVLAPVRVDFGVPVRMIEACGKSTIVITEDDQLHLTGFHFESPSLLGSHGSGSSNDGSDVDSNVSREGNEADPWSTSSGDTASLTALTERNLASLSLSDQDKLIALKHFRFTRIDLAQYCDGVDLDCFQIQTASSGDSHVALAFEEKPGVDMQRKLYTLQNEFTDVDIVLSSR